MRYSDEHIPLNITDTPRMSIESSKVATLHGNQHGPEASPIKANGVSEPVDLAGDPELEGLTLYEKKALLVNRELDRQGMGRYQWMIFLLCGFGYFLDLLWAQGESYVILNTIERMDTNANNGNSIRSRRTCNAIRIWLLRC